MGASFRFVFDSNKIFTLKQANKFPFSSLTQIFRLSLSTNYFIHTPYYIYKEKLTYR